MRATMMETPLTLAPLLRRAHRMFRDVEIVSRRPDQRVDRATVGDFVGQAARLAAALRAAGLEPGDRVATLMWNHVEHMATYFGVPCAGGVLHTLNLRLHPDDIAYIATHAHDRFLIVDDCLLPLLAKFRHQAPFEKVIVVGDRAAAGKDTPWADFLATAGGDTEQLLARLPDLDENAPLGMCYTSGTTGKPKGVVYSHRSTVLHSMAVAMVDCIGLGQRDVLLPVVPMFHANAWGIPFAAVMTGSKLVMPGPHLDAGSLLELMETERVTCAAGVPTIWAAILEQLDKQPRDLTSGLRMVVGGSAAPEAMIRAFDKHGLRVLHAWGMTETSPLGSVSYLRTTDAPETAGEAAAYAARSRQGYPVPLVDIRAVDDQGEIPWDDARSGELQVRGPWVAAGYHEQPDAADRWTRDGWFRTGDVVSISPHGSIRIVDRTKDLIKSGGEWISSVDLENALVAHPAVREAAVVAVPHPKWLERPLAVVVKKAGAEVTADELRAFLGQTFARFQVPDAVVFIDQIPKTSTGKMLKSALRERYAGWEW
jgi:acyl-CoA synthetase (AMP-forming)/AMP-acid ligase II